MASLQEIKSRLSSVETTKKITKAMQLVATAKLQKAKKNLNSIQEYYSSVYDMFQDLLANVKDASKLIPAKQADKVLYIAISSDIGLCGGYNSNVMKNIKSSFRRGNDALIMIGNKGIASANANGYKMLQQYPHIGDMPDYSVSSEIGKQALAMYLTGEVKEVRIIYTKFINSVTFETTSMQVLPVDTTNVKKQSNTAVVTEFEPSAEVVLQNALPLYVSALIFGAKVESKVSEMSSRRTAMENATDNADELIEKLDLEFNRMRQANITQEISEIVAGSETE